MNILEHTDPSEKKLHIEYFVHLIRIALADDIITDREMELLHIMGKMLGFTEPEIDNIIETNFTTPNELSVRFEQVYDNVSMTLADEVIDKKMKCL